jgi:carbon monoxide dehydrogenase subunit G
MELRHSFTVPTTPDEAWALFMDLEQVGGCFPGATVTEVTDDGFSGTVKVKLGPIQLLYTGSGSFVEKDAAARRAVIEAKGKDKRGNGTAGATVIIALEPDGDGTRADVRTDLAVTGKPAQFGRGVMQDVSDKLLGQFVACIESQFADGSDGSAAGPTAAPRSDAPESGSGPPESGSGASASAIDAPASSSGASAEPGDSASPADLDVPAGPTPSPSPRPAPSERPRPQPAAAARQGDDAIDLGSTVVPVLLRRYAGALAVGLAGFAVGVLVGRAGRE